KLKKQKEFITNYYSGIQNNYFIIASINTSTTQYTKDFVKMSIYNGENTLVFYYGERLFDKLSKYNLGVVINFGAVDFIGKIIYRAIIFINGFLGNWGWSLIVLTFLIHLLFLPLSIKAYKAQIKLKNIQPKLKLLQEKYKNDAKKLANEMRELYAKEGVNPFGGCLPLLLQIPIFWALFTVLTNTYELRNAEWILFIKDLSTHDKYYVLPILMGFIMFLQGFTQAPKEDPQQRNLAIIMPIVFTIMFLHAPSGLVLYWLTNSLISFIEFKILSKKLA
ncbi:MAG: membrane protein insertase YidC, partial [bacterium]|nr:membrane protein insertase YidC [bacterium]